MPIWKQMLPPTIIMCVVSIVLTVLAIYKGKSLEGMDSAWKIFYPIVPLLFFAFIVAGMVQVLLPQAWVVKWLGPESGWKGIFIACIAGGLIPGRTVYSIPPDGGTCDVFHQMGLPTSRLNIFVPLHGLANFFAKR